MTLTKEQALAWSEKYVCPDRTRFMAAAGVDLVIGRREGYRIWDIEGRELLDLHLNGGVYNLGHRNPEVLAELRDAMETLDIGNHHFPSIERAALAKALVDATPGMHYAVFASGGGEAIDLAIKSARRATGRRRVISARNAYHGHTGLALAAGDQASATAFLSDDAMFARVDFNDLPSLAAAMESDPAAAVILETVPATAGFPVPNPDYIRGVRALCDEHGAAYIADEVQTGLGRSGRLWATDLFGVTPDILVTGKGLSGGIYPIAATLLNAPMGAWLETDGWSHVSTFGGAELGCRVGGRVLEITQRREVTQRVQQLIQRWQTGLAHLQSAHPGWLVGIRQTGLIIGLEFAHPQGGMLMTKLLFDHGVWAAYANFEHSVLQVKPGLLLTDEDVDVALAAFDRACGVAESL